MRGSHTWRREGFTLVELLVVIAVVAILIGVLLPALAGARESGYRSVSSGNLRSLATLMNVYANDYDTEFPAIAGRPSPITSRYPDNLWETQARYGGFAGYFNLDQQVADPAAYKLASIGYYIWSTGEGRWVRRRPSDLGISDSQFNERARIPMNAYIEGIGDYAMLQNPADRVDGGENGTKTPAITPQTIDDVSKVVWHNISYLYVAGLNQRTPQLGLIGDETNHVDIGNDADASSWGFSSLYGTLRKNAPDGVKPGYNDQDNHGEAGGTFAFTDGHAEWISQTFGLKQANNPYSEGFDPHDRIFAEIALFLKDGPSSVETID